MKSYIIYAQNNLVSYHFTIGSFDKTNILQSNENHNINTDIVNIFGLMIIKMLMRFYVILLFKVIKEHN